MRKMVKPQGEEIMNLCGIATFQLANENTQLVDEFLLGYVVVGAGRFFFSCISPILFLYCHIGERCECNFQVRLSNMKMK